MVSTSLNCRFSIFESSSRVFVVTAGLKWEKEIDIKEAEELLLLCEPTIIEKTRYLIKIENHTYEVDEFFGDNEGLIVAEVELSEEKETVTIPNWIGKEVTGETKYYNSQLSKDPFKNWNDEN